jgi:hypothetical protein
MTQGHTMDRKHEPRLDVTDLLALIESAAAGLSLAEEPSGFMMALEGGEEDGRLDDRDAG